MNPGYLSYIFFHLYKFLCINTFINGIMHIIINIIHFIYLFIFNNYPSQFITQCAINNIFCFLIYFKKIYIFFKNYYNILFIMVIYYMNIIYTLNFFKFINQWFFNIISIK